MAEAIAHGTEKNAAALFPASKGEFLIAQAEIAAVSERNKQLQSTVDLLQSSVNLLLARVNALTPVGFCKCL